MGAKKCPLITGSNWMPGAGRAGEDSGSPIHQVKQTSAPALAMERSFVVVLWPRGKSWILLYCHTVVKIALDDDA